MRDILSLNADVARDRLMDLPGYVLFRVHYATERGMATRTMNLPKSFSTNAIGTVTDFGTVVGVERLGVK